MPYNLYSMQRSNSGHNQQSFTSADYQIMGIANNEFKYYPNDQIMHIANKDWLIKTSCPK